MSGVNKVILIGNLGADPEVRHLQNDVSRGQLQRIATSETYKDRTTGEKREQTEWHSVVAWRGLADVVEKYVRKGSKVYVEGKLRTRKWEKDGVERYTTEIMADETHHAGPPERGTMTKARTMAPRQAAGTTGPPNRTTASAVPAPEVKRTTSRSERSPTVPCSSPGPSS
jgi:single-strand DNA-binding protein